LSVLFADHHKFNMKPRNTTPMTDRGMPDRPEHHFAASKRTFANRLAVARRMSAFGAATLLLGACSGFGESAFVDPSKYELYNCQQLTTARTASNARVVELEGLMAKAETGAAGSVVSGLAYQTDYVSARGNRDALDAKIASNNCPAVAPAVAPAPPPPAAKRKH